MKLALAPHPEHVAESFLTFSAIGSNCVTSLNSYEENKQKGCHLNFQKSRDLLFLHKIIKLS